MALTTSVAAGRKAGAQSADREKHDRHTRNRLVTPRPSRYVRSIHRPRLRPGLRPRAARWAQPVEDADATGEIRRRTGDVGLIGEVAAISLVGIGELQEPMLNWSRSPPSQSEAVGWKFDSGLAMAVSGARQNVARPSASSPA